MAATMDVDTDQNRIQLQVQQEYVDFLDDGHQDGMYNKKINDMIKDNKIRLLININDLRRKNPARCTALVEHGCEELALLQKALREVISTIDQDYLKEHEEFFVGLEGSFGSKHVTPRTLNSRFLGSVICLEGIVTKCSTIHPKIVRSVHYCPATKKTMERKYTDITSLESSITSTFINIYPTKDDNGNLLETEYGLSTYRDHQTITVQEMPERAPTGQLPRALDILLDNDLVDTVKPGDRILVIGTYRCLPGKHGGFTTGVFKCTLIANNIILMTKDANLTITASDITECKKFAKTNNPFNTLAKSLAPSIHGHEFIKKAVLALLLGGVEKILPNRTRLRGDINILLIGDPSVAKSQMLRYVSNVAPRVVLTTGRGSSGVGLTAAVTTDNETGERRLEAGAMVLADRGIVCIDEFDKMSDVDRTSIHEVMEQGRVTIAKAGIHAKLNARTSVLAAANPVYGRYDEYKSPMENIGLQDSLLSRFDLVFTVLDVAEPAIDRTIADHVLRMHRYRNPTEQDGEPTPLFNTDQLLTTFDEQQKQNGEGQEATTSDQEQNATRKAKQVTRVYEKHDPLLHGTSSRSTRSTKILSMEFMKKYIHVAKCIKPNLSTEASVVISEEYTRLRSLNMEDQQIAKTTPITARSLETLIRLSTAFARGRMSNLVDRNDALAAIELVQVANFKKVLERKKKKRARADEADGDSSDGDDDEDNNENGQNGDERETTAKRPRTTEGEEEAMETDAQLDEHETSILEPEPVAGPSRAAGIFESQPTLISVARYREFKIQISDMFSNERATSLTKDSVLDAMSVLHGFTSGEILAGLEKMSEADLIMVSEGMVFLM